MTSSSSSASSSMSQSAKSNIQGAIKATQSNNNKDAASLLNSANQILGGMKSSSAISIMSDIKTAIYSLGTASNQEVIRHLNLALEHFK